jgi:predicted dehydrogenase
LWAVAETIATEAAYPAGVAPNVALTAINRQLSPHHTTQVRDFVQSLRDGTDPAVTGHDATKALRILLAVYESSRTGLPVRFDATEAGRPEIPSHRQAPAPAAG